MPWDHDDRDHWEDEWADREPPFEFFVVGKCAACGAPVAHFPGDHAAFCINDNCQNSEEAFHARLAANERDIA